MQHWILNLALLGALLPGAPTVQRGAKPDRDKQVYAADVAFALDALEEQCGGLFAVKDIDWKSVRKEMTKAAKKVRTDLEHRQVLWQLVARLQDGHAQVRASEAMQDLGWLGEDLSQHVGPGLFVCRIGKKIYVKTAYEAAAEVGLAPGMELLSIDKQKPMKWLLARQEELSDTWSFSTAQHAWFYTTHRGFRGLPGKRLSVEFKNLDGKKKKRTITYDRGSLVPNGPAFPPAGMQGKGKSVYYSKTESGFGYLHFRRIQSHVIEELDTALASLGNVPGMILDFRGNSGGGCDHDALEARFVPEGHEMPRLARGPLAGAGRTTYGGPLVVIVDGSTFSSGETVSGMFKEDGRAFMIGETPTAGASSQKTTIELPSGLFSLYVSVRSNRSSFNGGRGIEGIGVAPNEQLEYDPEHLAAGQDTMILRAEEILSEYPRGPLKDVRYDPAEYDWTP